MKAGATEEWKDSDGRTLRWCHHTDDELWLEEKSEQGVNRHVMWRPIATMPYPDKDAKAALDALIAEEQEEWVELNGYWRISTDGIKVQRRDWCEDGDPWVDTTEAPELVKLYRTGLAHGLSVAQAEHEALLVQVRALVEEILSVPLQMRNPETVAASRAALSELESSES